MKNVVGYRTIVAAVANALFQAGASMGWWAPSPELQDAIEQILWGLVVVFAALKLNRFMGMRHQATKEAAAKLLNVAAAGSHGPGKRKKKRPGQV